MSCWMKAASGGQLLSQLHTLSHPDVITDCWGGAWDRLCPVMDLSLGRMEWRPWFSISEGFVLTSARKKEKQLNFGQNHARFVHGFWSNLWCVAFSSAAKSCVSYNNVMPHYWTWQNLQLCHYVTIGFDSAEPKLWGTDDSRWAGWKSSWTRFEH